MNEEEQLLLDFSPEELKQASKLLADALANTLRQPSPELFVVTCVSGCQIVKEDQITQVISLDIIASASAGIVDPLGQLRDWFISVFNSVASWIVSGIQTFIQDIVVPAIKAVSDFLSGTVLPAIKGVVTSIGSAITDAIKSITSTISKFISDAVSTISKAITSVLSTLSTAITGAIKAITDALSSVGKSILDSISGIIKTVSDILSTIGKTITDFIAGSIKTLTDIIGTVAKGITDAISGIVSTLTNIISGAISTISNVISGILSAISTAISGAIATISNALTSVATSIMNAISGVISTISNALTSVATSIMNAISGVISTISNAIAGFATTIMNTITNAISTLSNIFSGIASSIMNALTGMINTISATLSGIAKTIIDAFGAIGKTILDAISGFIKAVSDTLGTVAKTIMDGLAGIGKGITDLWNFLVGAFQDVAAKVGAGFQVIGNALMGFINGIIQAGQWLVNAIQNLGAVIWQALPDWLKGGLTAIGNFFSAIVDGVKALIADPVGWFSKNIVQPIMGALDWLWNALQGVWNWITSAITKFGEWLWNGILALGQGLVSLLSASFKGLIDIGGKLIGGIRDILIAPILDLFKAVFTGLKDYVTGMVQRIAAGKSQGEMAEALGLFGVIVSTQFTFRMISQALFWIGEMTSDWKLLPNVAIKILGAGGETTVEIPLKFGNVIKHLASEFRQYPDELMRGFFSGIAIWITQPIVRSINSLFRNTLPIELPAVDVLVEATRRTMPHEKFNEMINKARYFLSLYGYSDYVIDLYFKTAKEFNITVTDRFGGKRAIPLSLMYQLPSSSDVATMMVRDIFATIDDFQKIYLATGMEKDVGVLYYFLRFRYPPPKRLWQFTVRGISGLLWTTLPDAERADVEKEVKSIGALMPVAPINMNFQADKLLNAFKTYMKWHDYFRGAWIKDFPSDNLIYIDTLAEVPTKIEQRWICKWGIYELLSAKQVTYQSTVKEFATKILENTPASEVKMDLTNFSRTILATGLHPDWVPITAVAEAMNALTEERTALRTGFMGLFKEGFYDIKALETMLAGFIKTSFQVAYFDIAQMKWTTGWVNIPVMYLPPERKLLELRALMDRSLDILREIQKDISTAYQEFIIWDYNEYKSKLTQVIESINDFYTADYEAITGVKLPDQLKLKFVEDYYKPYVEALKIWRDVFTIRRIRMWTQRWLGWVMYRVAYGVVEKDDISKLVTYVKEKAKLTDGEEEFIKQVMELMYGIARRSTVAEYLPTPSTLATLSEYMTLDTELVKQVLVERGLDEAWQKIWLTYIAVRPIKSDAKALLSTYVRGFRYGVVTKDKLESFIKTLPQYGFTEKEINFIIESINIEEQILEAKSTKAEYLPTPSTLATLSEYVAIPMELVKETLEERAVPAEWADLWMQYVAVKPIKADAKALLSTYVRAFRYGAITKETLDNYIKTLPQYGFTQREVEFIIQSVQLEEQILDFKASRQEYIPTPSMLATICEIIPEAREFFDDVVKARNIPTEWQKVWAKYIDLKPVIDEVKKYVSRAEQLYVRFMITEEDFKKVLDEVRETLGYTQKEIEFMLQTTRLEKHRVAWTELIGDVDRMTMLAEYSPKAREFALGTMYKMIDALPIDQPTKEVLKEMWTQYIRIKPVKDEVGRYVTDLINAYVAGTIDATAYAKELDALREWGLDDYEIQFYKAIATLRRARKLKIALVYPE
jgi:phage-related protein